LRSGLIDDLNSGGPFLAELNVDRIAEEAFALVNEKGAGAFTLRAVAQRLGVTPMALYHHVPDKTALTGLVIDRAILSRALPDLTDDWKYDILTFANWIRAGARTYPEITNLRRSNMVMTPMILSLSQHWQSIWDRSGLESDASTQAAIMSSLAIHGLVYEAMAIRSQEVPNKSALEKDPTIARFVSLNPDPDHLFDLTVRSIVDGFYAQLSSKK
tara:strand:+ start:81770 stop:82414 length:645 start_codon:yes stop_codon:yes gene_type:complete